MRLETDIQLITMEKTALDDGPPPTFDDHDEEFDAANGKVPGHYDFNHRVSRDWACRGAPIIGENCGKPRQDAEAVVLWGVHATDKWLFRARRPSNDRGEAYQFLSGRSASSAISLGIPHDTFFKGVVWQSATLAGVACHSPSD